MRVAVAAVPRRADDVRAWSGVPLSIVDHLEARGVDRVVVGPGNRSVLLAGRLVAAVTGRLGSKVNWEVEPRWLRHVTRRVTAEAVRAGADVVVALGWHPVDPPADGPPLVFWGDATFAQRVDVSPHWSGLSARTRTLIEPVEGAALRGVAQVLMASTAARDDAVARYGLPVGRVRRVGFGANCRARGQSPRPAPGRSPARLLSVGVHWHRKGLDTSVAVADRLVAAGTPVHLDVVGALPPDRSWARPHVTYHGFLDRADDGDSARLEELYRRADVFLLPTRNEPFGIVFAEAAAFGLPAVGTRVGGVPDIVVDRHTGILVDEHRPESAWTDAVLHVLRDDREYARMSGRAVAHHRDHLTWAAAVEELMEACRTAVADGPGQR